MYVVVVGNCQSSGIAACLRALTGGSSGWRIESIHLHGDLSAIRDKLDAPDLVFIQPQLQNDAVNLGLATKVRLFPRIAFQAYHPDAVHVGSPREPIKTKLGLMHSLLVLHGYLNGLTESQTEGLFCNAVVRHMRYDKYMEVSERNLQTEGIKANLPLDDLIGSWKRSGCFMHLIHHPKIKVLGDVSRRLLQREGIEPIEVDIHSYVADHLLNGMVWPIYPAIAQAYGLKNGSYLFKASDFGSGPGLSGRFLTLTEFVRCSYQAYAQYPADKLSSPRLQDRNLAEVVAIASRSLGPRKHPYVGLGSQQSWRTAVAGVAPKDIDPVVSGFFTIGRADKVASAGSCFAQHIARALRSAGLTYWVPESAPANLPAAEARRRNFEIYSARYGNIYTARQLLQLFTRANGRFVPRDDVWRREDGRLADAFRPEIEPDGFATETELRASREEHFKWVRTLFEEMDCFLFTLGLTEAWVSKKDGAVYPLAPGVSAGEMSDDYAFKNFTCEEVARDLSDFMRELRAVNPSVRTIFTVSPVPLAATYEERHVLVSTNYSKSVLRVAAEEIAKSFPDTHYFPSFEIVTGTFNRGSYFHSDLRSVTQEGVDHVMRLFLKHYTCPENSVNGRVLQDDFEIVCEEDLLQESPALLP